MKREGLVIIMTIGLSLFFIHACKKDKNPDHDNNKNCNIDIDTIDFTFGIDYDNPSYYLLPGEESDLSDLNLEEVREELGTPENSIEFVLQVCNWVNQNFTFQNAGGNMIGVNTVDELFALRTYYGCHSAALVISSILRELGFPAIMIETADVNWAYNYHDDRVDNFAGHVMSEICVAGKWILLDNNGYYVDDYDQLNPFIIGSGPSGDPYFAFAKGIDIWQYSGKDDSFTYDNLLFFAQNIYCFEVMFYTVNYTWKN